MLFIYPNGTSLLLNGKTWVLLHWKEGQSGETSMSYFTIDPSLIVKHGKQLKVDNSVLHLWTVWNNLFKQNESKFCSIG